MFLNLHIKDSVEENAIHLQEIMRFYQEQTVMKITALLTSADSSFSSLAVFSSPSHQHPLLTMFNHYRSSNTSFCLLFAPLNFHTCAHPCPGSLYTLLAFLVFIVQSLSHHSSLPDCQGCLSCMLLHVYSCQPVCGITQFTQVFSY